MFAILTMYGTDGHAAMYATKVRLDRHTDRHIAGRTGAGSSEGSGAQCC